MNTRRTLLALTAILATPTLACEPGAQDDGDSTGGDLGETGDAESESGDGDGDGEPDRVE